jgi:O-antigen/teichoic acid export membrane protein
MLNKEILVYVGLNLISKFFPFIFLPLVADSLGTNDYAAYGTLIAISGFLAFFNSFSFDSSLNKFYENSRLDDAPITTLLTILYLLSTTFLLVAPILLILFGKYEFFEILFLIVVPMYATWVSIWDRYLRITHELKFYVATILMRNILLYGPVDFLLLVSKLDYKSYMLLISFQASVIAIAALVYFIHRYGVQLNFKKFIDIWDYSRPLIPNKIIAFGIQPSLIFCVKLIYSVKILAVYIFAQTLGNGLNVVTQAMTNAINPLIFHAHTRNTIESDTRRILGPQFVYGLLCIFCIEFCTKFLDWYVPDDFSEVRSILPYFILYSWMNFNKNLMLTYTMIDEKRVKYVPYSTYLFIAVTFGLIFYLSSSYDVQIIVISMIIGRIFSITWLLIVSGKVLVTIPIITIGLIGASVMSLQLVLL